MPIAVVGLRLRVLLSALALIVLVLLVQPAGAVSPNLVVSQVYGGGGNTGASFTNDFIEIFNRGTSSVDLDGFSLQYASATGTGNFGANSAQLTELPSITVAPGQYVLVQEASGGANGAALPPPDVTDPDPINMAAGPGRSRWSTVTRPSAATAARLRAMRRTRADRRPRRLRERELLRGLRGCTDADGHQPRRYEATAAASTPTTTPPTSPRRRPRRGTPLRSRRPASATPHRP